MTTTSETQIAELIEKLDQKLDRLDEKFDQKIDVLEDKINQKFDAFEEKIDQKFDRFEEKIDQKIDKLDEKLSLKIEKLDEKVEQINVAQGKLNGIDKRLDRLEIRVDDQDKRFWTLIIGAFLALFGLLAKMAFFSGQIPIS